MAESVDALVSNTSGATRPGSTPGLGTKLESKSSASLVCRGFFLFSPYHDRPTCMFMHLWKAPRSRAWRTALRPSKNRSSRPLPYFSVLASWHLASLCITCIITAILDLFRYHLSGILIGLYPHSDKTLPP